MYSFTLDWWNFLCKTLQAQDKKKSINNNIHIKNKIITMLHLWKLSETYCYWTQPICNIILYINATTRTWAGWARTPGAVLPLGGPCMAGSMLLGARGQCACAAGAHCRRQGASTRSSTTALTATCQWGRETEKRRLSFCQASSSLMHPHIFSGG